jgi:AcrR family transcriptional regulator
MTAVRAPQQDRSRATRQRLLDAAISSLVDQGWTHSTVAVVARRAGVSRGAAQHHFPTREALITAAVEYVTQVRAEDMTRELDGLPTGPLRTEAIVEIIVGWFIGAPFRAALELWVAASANPQLRERVVPLEVQAGRQRTGPPSTCSAWTRRRPGCARRSRPPWTWPGGSAWPTC